IQENEKLIRSQGVERRNFEVLKLLFINMHTIKGSARSLYFKRMTRVFHDVEQYYAHLQKERQASWDVEKMAQDLSEARKIVELYESLAKEKLGRSSEQTHFVEFRIEHVEAIYRNLRESTRGKELPGDVLASIDQIQTLFHHKIYKDANDVFHEIFGCLAVLAKDLHKEHPEVILETNGILLGEQADELFRNTFVHLLRNAMDHGIESSAERIKAGKPPKGTVSITMQRHDDIMRLTYQDDGRGLHMKKIFEIGLARGLLKAADAAHGSKIAGLIFDSGLSTANQVTDISGRGVGMDAVKRYIQECEGDIRIELLEDRKTNPDYCPFRFVMDLPFHMFDDDQDVIGRAAA
ncbi:ATP-binding protein, partial [Oligoflexus tunisiensis]